MASLGSRIKSSVSNAVKKVSNAVSNTAKQATAIASSIGKSNTASVYNAPKPTGGMTRVPANGGYPTSSPGSIKSSPSSAGMSTMSPSGAPMSTSAALQASRSSSGSSSKPNMTPVPANMTSVTTGQPAVGGYRRTTGSSGGSRSNSNLAGAYGALQNMVGANSSNASDGGPGVTNSTPYTPDTYKGMAGNNQTTYYAGQGRSLEAQGLMAGKPASGLSATPEQRQANQATVSTWDNSASTREAQAAALRNQMAEERAARDSMAPAAVANPLAEPSDPMIDPHQERLDKEEETWRKRESDTEREIEKLTRPSAEYLQAQQEEEGLTAEEMRIKDQMNQDIYGIKGQAVPQGFLTGQSARVQDLANVGLDRIAGQKVTIQQKLANEQARRAAALDVVKGNAARISSRTDRATDRKFDYTETLRKNKREDERYAVERSDKATTAKFEQDLAMKKFNEDVRQFGVSEARMRQSAGSSASKPTEFERRTGAYSTINQLMGSRNAQGVPYTDGSGYFTAKGFKDIVNAAAEDGITRADILSQYAGQISPYGATGYGLTAKEKETLGIK